MTHTVQPDKYTLENGVRLITVPLPSSGTVTVLVLVGTGSEHETKQLNGISHFLEHMVFKGTEKRPQPLDIALELDAIGGAYNAFTSEEFTGFWVKAGPAKVETAFDVLSDVLFNSKYATEELEREKQVIYEEMHMYQDTPQRHIADVFEELLYGDQAAGRSIIGTKESVGGITSDNIKAYLKKQFTGENVVVVVAGDVQPKDTQKLTEKYFAGYTKEAPGPKEPFAESQSGPQVKLHYKDTDQAHLSLGVRSFNMFDDRRYPLAILSNLLGGLMSSRLFVEIREKRGMAYYVYTFNELRTQLGYTATRAGLDVKRIEEAIEVILAEYKKMAADGITDKDLQLAKDNTRGKLALSLETSDAWAQYVATQEVLKGEISLPADEYAKINKVTQDEVQQVAQDIFVENHLNLAIIGPFKDETPFKKLLNFS